MTKPARVIGFVPNLLDRGRIEPVVRAGGATLELVSSVEALPGACSEAPAPEVVLVDLDRAASFEIFAQLDDLLTLGFGSHVDRERLDRARAAGCRQVSARSALTVRLAAALAAVRSAQ